MPFLGVVILPASANPLDALISSVWLHNSSITCETHSFCFRSLGLQAVERFLLAEFWLIITSSYSNKKDVLEDMGEPTMQLEYYA